MRRGVLLLVVLALFAAACGDDEGETAADEGEAAAEAGGEAPDEAGADGASTDEAGGDGEAADEEGDTEGELEAIRVPEDHPTIQEAVDAARPGDLVLIAPGVYEESVIVETDEIVIRGLDRNEVILEGGFERENGIIVFSNGVAVENLTARNYTSNGVFFTGDYDADILLEGYRASYVTAHNNGLYGVYAFNARYGLMEHSYGSGHPDSAFYIGQCQPCDAVITDVLAENNTLGYSGTNAGGNLHVVNSEWRNNRVGVVPNTLDSEELAPQRGAVFAGNHIHSNGNAETTLRNEVWDLAYGLGIIVAGGRDNVVTRNLVENHATGGIGVSLFADENVWLAEDNTVSDNVVSGNLYDLLLLVDDGTQGADGNCFEGNTFESSLPADIETVAACGAGTGDLGELLPLFGLAELSPGTNVPYEEIPAPGPQENMPDAATAPPRPASSLPEVDDFDLDAVTLPEV